MHTPIILAVTDQPGPSRHAHRPVAQSDADHSRVGIDGTPPAANGQAAPQISVIIPARNASSTIGGQLRALAGHGCPVPWEVLVCDNGSTDHTRDVVTAYADRLPVRLVDASDRRGSGHARNCGAEAARAPLLAFCDADDEVGEGWPAVMLAALGSHAFVAGRFDGARLNSWNSLRSRMLDQQQGLQRSAIAGGMPYAGAGNLGVSREAFRAVGGFDPDLRCLQDADFCLRVQLAGVPLVYVPELVVSVRLRSTLRQMYRQGRDYGRAYALLEHRYGALAATTPDGDAVAARWTGVTRRSRTALRVARTTVRHGGIGYPVWQLGWHLGHRSFHA